MANRKKIVGTLVTVHGNGKITETRVEVKDVSSHGPHLPQRLPRARPLLHPVQGEEVRPPLRGAQAR